MVHVVVAVVAAVAVVASFLLLYLSRIYSVKMSRRDVEVAAVVGAEEEEEEEAI